MPPSTRQSFVIPWKVGEGKWMSFSGANRFKGISDVKRGYKTYELSNHLGNVLATVSDRRVSGTCTDSIVDFYDADILTISDYYPFGMTMQGRTQYAEKYRFGFNGKEGDDEIKGLKSSYDFGARMYNPRIGRWLSVDPMFSKQPGWSTYKAFLNNPIIYVDPDGETEYLTIITFNEKTGETMIEQKTANKVMTDGIKHTVPGWNPFGGPTATWSYENRYYDYNTVILRTVGADGKVTETSTSQIMYDKFKKSSAVWFNGAKAGETTVDSWSEYFSDMTDIGGVIIYGSASSSKDSPGSKTKGKVWGSFDFAAFSEIMGLVTTAVSSKGENSLGPDFSGTKAADLASKTKEVVEYNQQHKNSYCRDCKRTFDADGNVIQGDNSPKDTIRASDHK